MNIYKLLTMSLALLALTGCLDKKAKEVLKQTGQDTIYINGDDAYYQIGKTPSFTTTNNTIKDNATGLFWQDDNHTKTNKQPHSKALSYCSNLTLDKSDDGRL